jgi:hypothetical protein
LEIVRDLNKSSGEKFQHQSEDLVTDFLAHSLEVQDWIDGEYELFPEYKLTSKQCRIGSSTVCLHTTGTDLTFWKGIIQTLLTTC